MRRMRRKRKRSKLRIYLPVIILAVAAMAVGGLIIAQRNEQSTLRVTLTGEREVALEYGTPYMEPGAAGHFSGSDWFSKPADVPVNAEGTVDHQNLGSYLLKYTANYRRYVGTAYRLVHVVDTQAPVITLVADPDKFTFPYDTYVEEGFTAVDNYDGDVTERVQRVQTREKVIYTVMDSSGNVAVVERQIVYKDPIPPVLALKGNKTVAVITGQKYTEPGFSASDNCDGDLTSAVSVTGYVDTGTPGTYTLMYTVKDSYENVTSEARTVVVLNRASDLGDNIETVIPNGKVIYLTFDDGPSSHTPRLLDVLKKYNVKATFFVVNTKYIGTLQRIAQEGHSIGIHTATHDYSKIYASEEAYFNDLYKMRDIIKRHTGIETTLIRFPGGSSNTTSQFNPGIMTRLAQLVQEAGLQYFDWNVSSQDAGGAKTSDQVYRNVINRIAGNKISVVLQHDTKGFSVDAVEQIIIWGLRNGYTFLPLEATSPGCHHNINN